MRHFLLALEMLSLLTAGSVRASDVAGTPPQKMECGEVHRAIQLRNGQMMNAEAVIHVTQCDHVILRWLSNRAETIQLPEYGIEIPIIADSAREMTFTANKTGRFRFALKNADGSFTLMILSVEVRPRPSFPISGKAEGSPSLPSVRAALGGMEEPIRSGVLAGIGRMLGEFNDAEGALEVSSWMAPHTEREAVVIAAATARAACGDPRGARDLAISLVDPGDKAEALLAIAKVRREKDESAVWSLTSEAMRFVVKAGPDDRRNGLLGFAAEDYASIGHYTDVQQTVERIADPPAKAMALAQAAWAFLRWRTGVRGEENRAPALAAGIADPGRRADAFTRLLMVPVGDLDAQGQAAVEAARQIARPVERDSALGRIVAALANVGRISWAEQVARSIGGSQQRDWAQVEIVEGIARNGDLSDIRGRIAAIADDQARSDALLAAVRVTAELADGVAAQALADETQGPLHDRALAILAIAARRAGHPERSLALAEDITDPGQRAMALAAGTSPLHPCQGQEAPDQFLLALVRHGGNAGDKIEILNRSGYSLFNKRPAKTRHLAIERTGWTADSQFFVWSGVNAAGHQPWHHPIFFWSRKTNRVGVLEDHLSGSISQAAFLLSPPAIVEGMARTDFGHPEQPFRLDLGSLLLP